MSVVPTTRLITKPFVAVTAATMAFFVYVGILVPVLPTFIEHELHGGELGVGLSVASFALAAILLRPVIAVLIERFGRRAVIAGGALVAATAGFATVLVDSLGPLIGLRGVAGVGEAALFVGAATLVADLAPPHRRAEAASYFSVAVFMGLGLGPVLGEALITGARYHLAFGVAALFSVAAALLALALPAVVVPVGSAEPSSAGPEDEPRPQPAAAPSDVSLAARFVHPAALGPGVVLAAGIGAFAVFSAFVPEHARDVGLSGSGGVFAVYSAVCLLLRLTGARLPERLGPRRAVTIALCSTGSALLLLAAVPHAEALWVAAALVGVGQAFLYPSLMALTVNRVAEWERPRALGSFTMFFDIGTVAGGLALGTVAQLLGKRSAFGAAVAVAAFGLWMLWTRVTSPAAIRAAKRRDERPAALVPATLAPSCGD